MQSTLRHSPQIRACVLNSVLESAFNCNIRRETERVEAKIWTIANEHIMSDKTESPFARDRTNMRRRTHRRVYWGKRQYWTKNFYCIVPLGEEGKRGRNAGYCLNRRSVLIPLSCHIFWTVESFSRGRLFIQHVINMKADDDDQKWTDANKAIHSWTIWHPSMDWLDSNLRRNFVCETLAGLSPPLRNRLFPRDGIDGRITRPTRKLS